MIAMYPWGEKQFPGGKIFLEVPRYQSFAVENRRTALHCAALSGVEVSGVEVSGAMNCAALRCTERVEVVSKWCRSERCRNVEGMGHVRRMPHDFTLFRREANGEFA